MRDLVNSLGPAQSIGPVALGANATVNGAGVDLRGFDSAMGIVETGVVTDGTHTFELQESDDNSAFTAVAAADLEGANPAPAAANDATVYKLGYKGTKRYIRWSVTSAGVTTGGVVNANIVRGHAHQKPVA